MDDHGTITSLDARSIRLQFTHITFTWNDMHHANALLYSNMLLVRIYFHLNRIGIDCRTHIPM